MNETLRKIVKLAKGVLTGKTACRNCGYVVHARNPKTILVELGAHSMHECGPSMEDFMRSNGADEEEIERFQAKQELAKSDHPDHQYSNSRLCPECYNDA